MQRLRATHFSSTAQSTPITTITTIAPAITTKTTTITTITTPITSVTTTPSASLTSTPVPRWRHHPMHKHMLCFKQWPVRRWWLWCSSASASAVHLLQHLLCLLLLIVLRNLHVLVERRLLHWQQQLQCLHFLFLRLLQHWVPAVLRLLLFIWQQRQQRPL